jgi:heptosyltransferase-2
MSEPALSEVERLFPGAKLHLLVRPAIAELFKGHPAVHRILVYEHQGRHAGLSGKWSLARELRRFAFDLGILFQNAFEAALLTHLAGIPNRYGYATDGRGWLLTESVPVPRTKGHHSRYYLDLLRPLGADGTGRPPRLFVSSEAEETMTRRLEQLGVAVTDVVIGLNPGSTYGSAKRWRPERFAETVDRLARAYGARVVLVGAPGEETLGKTVAEAMRTDPILLSGRTSVRELMAVIARCRLFLTNDTGPMHIAAAFGVPIVAIFGPTDWATTAPFGNNHRIVREPVECSPCLLRECPIDHRCMTGVSVERVYEAAVQLLGPTDVEQAYPSQARRLPFMARETASDRAVARVTNDESR